MSENNKSFTIETGWKPVIRENSLEGLTAVGKIEKEARNVSKQCDVIFEKEELLKSRSNIKNNTDKDELKQKTNIQIQNEDLTKIHDMIESAKNDINKKLDALSQDIDVLISIILETTTRQESKQKKSPLTNFLKKIGIR